MEGFRIAASPAPTELGRRGERRRVARPRLLAVVILLSVAQPCALLAQSAPEPEIRRLISSGPVESSVDVVFVGDGYSRRKAAKFWKDVDRYTKRLLEEPPFSWYKARFNVAGAFREQAALARILDAVQGVDIAFIMVNVEKYGGSGSVLYARELGGRSLPAPTFAAQDTTSFLIAIHELGHSFADLADEYEDSAVAARFPVPPSGDVNAPNATLPGQFDPATFESLKRTVKWKHLLELPGAAKFKWVYEGAYYRAKGVFRPWKRCMMLSLGDPLCPVCAEEMAKVIVETCGEAWDDAAFHKKYPLSIWK